MELLPNGPFGPFGACGKAKATRLEDATGLAADGLAADGPGSLVDERRVVVVVARGGLSLGTNKAEGEPGCSGWSPSDLAPGALVVADSGSQSELSENKSFVNSW